ncbi:hypothetical protein N9V29_00275 [Flavobacteriales bacterium]|nr:hypothetical protein [Flavobacteriales bacterium]
MSDQNNGGETAYMIAKRKARSIARNEHVKALTVRMSDLKSGHKGRAQQALNEYWLRRMWATQLLHDMRAVLGWEWDVIHEHTGRTKQSWYNVTQSKIPQASYFFDRYETILKGRRIQGRPKRHHDPEVHEISRTFIAQVTDNLERIGNIQTSFFRDAFDQGLVTASVQWEEPENFDKGVRRREHVLTMWQSFVPGWDEGEQLSDRDPFPLFRATSSERQAAACEDYLRGMERAIFKDKAQTEGIQHKRDSEAEFKAVQQRMIEQQAAKVDPVNFADPTPVNWVDPKVDHMGAMGFVQVPIMLDVHPMMVKDGKVKFTVELTMNDAMICTGKATHHVPE